MIAGTFRERDGECWLVFNKQFVRRFGLKVGMEIDLKYEKKGIVMIPKDEKLRAAWLKKDSNKKR